MIDRIVRQLEKFGHHDLAERLVQAADGVPDLSTPDPTGVIKTLLEYCDDRIEKLRIMPVSEAVLLKDVRALSMFVNRAGTALAREAKPDRDNFGKAKAYLQLTIQLMSRAIALLEQSAATVEQQKERDARDAKDAPGAR